MTVEAVPRVDERRHGRRPSSAQAHAHHDADAGARCHHRRQRARRAHQPLSSSRSAEKLPRGRRRLRIYRQVYLMALVDSRSSRCSASSLRRCVQAQRRCAGSSRSGIERAEAREAARACSERAARSPTGGSSAAASLFVVFTRRPSGSASSRTTRRSSSPAPSRSLRFLIARLTRELEPDGARNPDRHRDRHLRLSRHTRRRARA